MSTIALIYHPDYLAHDTGPTHPESPSRLRAIVDHLHLCDLWNTLIHLEPRMASPEEITWVHTPAYIERVRSVCEQGGGLLDDHDTVVGRASYHAACRAVGGVFTAIDAVMHGQADHAFCAVRPPGHHAEADHAKGFCLFNNVALGARYVQRAYGLKNVLIVDWDVHHGNGTQHIFYDDPTVLYFSTHLWGWYFFPGTGRASERGHEAGEGYTINVPFSWGDGDGSIVEVFREQLIPAADRFRPDFVLLSAGFDAHQSDPLAALNVTEEGFEEMTRIVRDIARNYAGGRIVSVLEGGYHHTALVRSVERHLRTLQS